MFKVVNPSEFDISVVINGVPYTVLSKSELSNVPEESALYWKKSLHNFLQILDDTDSVVTIEKLADDHLSEEEEVVETEEIEETPKKKTTKK